MKICLSLILFLILAAPAVPQKPAPAKLPLPVAQQFIVKKQQLVDDFELELRDTPYAVVRIYIRYRLARWLWKNDSDDTARAEPLAVRAIEELYGKKDEIPPDNLNTLSKDLFSLLEKNAPDTAARLKKKYGVGAGSDVYAAYDKIDKPGGDIEAAQAIVRSLAAGTELDEMIPVILSKMSAMRSPQVMGVLGAILDAMEAERIGYDLKSLDWIFQFFISDAVPASLKTRYFALVLGKARAQLQQPQSAQPGYDYRLLENVIFALGKNAPDLVGEAEAVRLTLINRSTGVTSARLEADRRIAEADDKVAAYLDEADKMKDEGQKIDYYIRAINLAISESKFQIAIDTIDKLRSLNQRDFIDPWTDIQLGQITRQALQKNDVPSAMNAIEDIRDAVRRAESWKQAAVYFNGKKDAFNSRDALDKAIKLLRDESGENQFRVLALLRAIPDVQRIDRTRLTELNVLAAKAINELPTPGVDDKPGTVNYQRYIAYIFEINRILEVAMPGLSKENRVEAEDLAGRIQKKEIRVFVDMLLAIDKLETAKGVK